MDVYSGKFAAIIIIALLCILTLQIVTNSKDTAQQIDSETCELYIQDSNINAKKYLNKYDEKCLDFKGLANP